MLHGTDAEGADMSVKIRTGYSFRHAVGLPDEIVDWASQQAWPGLAIADTGAFGWVRWAKACKKRDIKPVFGLELAVALQEGSLHVGKPVTDMCTFIAKNTVEPLSNLFHTATDQFRYQPLLSLGQAFGIPGVTRIVGHRT